MFRQVAARCCDGFGACTYVAPLAAPGSSAPSCLPIVHSCCVQAALAELQQQQQHLEAAHPGIADAAAAYAAQQAEGEDAEAEAGQDAALLESHLLVQAGVHNCLHWLFGVELPGRDWEQWAPQFEVRLHAAAVPAVGWPACSLPLQLPVMSRLHAPPRSLPCCKQLSEECPAVGLRDRADAARVWALVAPSLMATPELALENEGEELRGG